jgi:hypothetical protein
VAAEPVELELVAVVREPMLTSNLLRPTLNLGTLHLDRGSATPAHEVVVMLIHLASSVKGLPAIRQDDVDLPGSRQGLEGAIHGREADPAILVPESVVNFLGAPKTSGAVEQLRDGGTLAGLPPGRLRFRDVS